MPTSEAERLDQVRGYIASDITREAPGSDWFVTSMGYFIQRTQLEAGFLNINPLLEIAKWDFGSGLVTTFVKRRFGEPGQPSVKSMPPVGDVSDQYGKMCARMRELLKERGLLTLERR